MVISKEKNAEDWCFVCKDGGDLIICDFQGCVKSYHPACVEKDDSYFGSETHWTCAWHTCFICDKSSNLHCYTCTSAVCSRTRCLRRAEILPVKGQYGFCQPCLELALLIEEGKDCDSDGEMVDFEDLETVEGLFSEYYKIIKKEEGFEPQNFYAAKDGVKTTKISNYSSEDNCEEDEISDYDGAEHVKKYRSGRKKIGMQTPVKLSKNDFIGWGSRALIDFLSSIGKSTNEQLSRSDVTSIVNAYVKERNLMHPVKRKMILCDARLESLFRKKTMAKNKVHELLWDHFAENHDESEEDEMGYDSEDDNAVCKKQRKLNSENKSPEKELADDVPLSCFASIVVENVKLVYLRRSLLLELLKQPTLFEEKVVGCFIRVKSDPYHNHSRKLMQVRGGSSTESQYSS
ncbi:zinc finger CCCH domain-containing protein 19-like [Salvia splendens]|uniref:zinc finger CCCH domain-containing protein 19-like n=1 Tax=Salvia splendens TaxID=180675 RepID=UPI001C27635C|nr:zinc finger CCCH domain-containing protein 19-like [Salvia splendens]